MGRDHVGQLGAGEIGLSQGQSWRDQVGQHQGQTSQDRKINQLGGTVKERENLGREHGHGPYSLVFMMTWVTFSLNLL